MTPDNAPVARKKPAERLCAACLLVAASWTFAGVPTRSVVATEPATAAAERLVEVSLAVRGSLFAEASPERSPVSQPIELDARFRFTEPAAAEPTDLAGGGEGDQRAPLCRRYHAAMAEFATDGRRSQTTLAADAADLLVSVRGTTPIPYLADGFLSREEADLLDVPFDAALVDQMRPTAAVRVAETWRVAADLSAGLLAIDTVESGGIDARLVAVRDGVAEVALEGTVTGAIDGAATRIEITGSYRCSATPDADRWLLRAPIEDLSVDVAERREAGWVAPGLDVTATLTLRRAPTERTRGEAIESADQLAPPVADRPSGPGRPGIVWERHRQGRYSLVLDERWRVVEDSSEGLVMRLLDRGALIAQCSILPLPRTAAEKPPELETVRRDVERSLGDQFGQIASAESTTRGDGTRVVRVVAEGTAEDRPFRWIHQVLTDPAGYRAAVTCMHEPAMADRFGIADRELVAGLVLMADRPDEPLREARNRSSSPEVPRD